MQRKYERCHFLINSISRHIEDMLDNIESTEIQNTFRLNKFHYRLNSTLVMLLVRISKEKLFEELYLFCKILKEPTGDEIFKLISEHFDTHQIETLHKFVLMVRKQWQKVVKAFTYRSHYKPWDLRNALFSS